MNERYDSSLLEAYPGTHEKEVLEVMFTLNGALMFALEREYGDRIANRGWSVCEPESILRARFCSAITGVPFQQGGTDEYLEIMLGIKHYRFGEGVEHAGVHYVPGGRDEEIFFDGTCGLQWEGNTNPNNALTVFHGSPLTVSLDEALAIEGFYPFIPKYAHLFKVDVWGDDRPTPVIDYIDHLTIMHQDQVFHRTAVGPSGREYDISDYWGDHLSRAAETTFSMLPAGLIGSIDQVLVMDSS